MARSVSPKSNAPSAAHSPSAHSPSVRAEMYTLFAYFFVFGMVGASWLVRLPEVRTILDITTAQLGWILFAFSVGAMTGILASGNFVARFGARAAALLGISLLALGYFGEAMGVALAGTGIPSVGVVATCAVVAGFGSGIGDVGINVEGTDMEKRLNRSLMPPLHGAFSIGTLAGAGVGTVAIAIGIPLPIQIYVLCALVAVIAWTTIRFLPRVTGIESRIAGPKRTDRSPAPWGERRIIFLGIAIFGLSIAEGAGNDWLALSMVDDYLTDPIRASIAFAVMMAAMTIVRFTGGFMVDRFGRVPVLRTFAIVGIVGLLMIILSHNYALALVGAALWGVGVSLAFPVLLSAAADGENSSRKVSIVASFGYVAFLVGPPMLGYLGQSWGLLNMFFVLVALMAVTVIFVGGARPIAHDTSSDGNGNVKP